MNENQQRIREQKLQVWKPIIEECEDKRPPELSKKRWMKERGIASGLYYYWLHVIRPSNDTVHPGNTRDSTQQSETVGLSSEDFVDITDLVMSQDGTVCCGKFHGQGADSSQNRMPYQPEPASRVSGTGPEAMIETRSCNIYLFSSIQKETIQKIGEVFHVC